MGQQFSLSHIHILCTFCASKINNRGSKLLQRHFLGSFLSGKTGKTPNFKIADGKTVANLNFNWKI